MIKRILAVLGAAGLLAGCGGGTTTSSPSTAPPTSTAPSPTATIDAPAIFAANCAACHGANRQGFVGPELTAAALQSRGRTDDYIRDTITNGRNGMPTWKGKLTPAQIEALIRFLRS